MKKRLIGCLILLILFVLNNQLINAETCNKELQIFTYLDTFSGDNFSKRSLHDFPDFKEDDTLFVDKIFIKNKANCNSTPYYIKYSTERPDNLTYFDTFCSYSTFTIPPLEVNKTYSIEFSKIVREIKGDDPIIQKLEYKDSLGKDYNLCRLKLVKDGNWVITTELIPVDTAQSGQIYRYFVDKDNFARDGFFKVHSKVELEIFDITVATKELTEATKNLTKTSILVVIIIGIISILYQHKQIKQDQERHLSNQKNLLISLLTDLSQVAKTSESYKKDIFILNVKNNLFIYLKIVGINNVLKNKSWDFLKILMKDNFIKSIENTFKNDKEISIKIKELCKLAIDKIEKEYANIKHKPRLRLPHFQLRQIDGNFYSTNLDRFIPDINKDQEFETVRLKNLLINLTEIIEVINYQLNYINDNTSLLKDKEGSYKWYSYYYRIFMNLHDLDTKINNVLNELLYYEEVKIYFNVKLNQIKKSYKNKKIDDEVLQNIEVLNRIYQRLQK